MTKPITVILTDDMIARLDRACLAHPVGGIAPKRSAMIRQLLDEQLTKTERTRKPAPTEPTAA